MVVIVSCKQSDTTPANTTTGKTVPVLYAKGFTITQYDGYKIVVVRDPLDTNKIIQQYRLITDKQFAGNHPNEINLTNNSQPNWCRRGCICRSLYGKKARS